MLGCEQGEGKAISFNHVKFQHLCEIDVAVTMFNLVYFCL